MATTATILFHFLVIITDTVSTFSFLIFFILFSSFSDQYSSSLLNSSTFLIFSAVGVVFSLFSK